MIKAEILKRFEKKNVLVTGGTGLIGRQIVTILCDAGAKVKVVSLDRICIDDRAEHVLGDLTDFSLCKELTDAKIDFQRQVAMPVIYKETQLEAGFRADIVIGDELLVEIKAVEKLMPVHEAQVLTYLKFGGFKKGLLINFNTKLLKDGVKRFVM